MGEGAESRVGGRMNVRMVLSALEVTRVVPSDDLEAVSWFLRR